MVPNIKVLTTELTTPSYPSRTYKINVDANRIVDYCDDLESVAQAIYLILSTERYEYIIYSWDYGVELIDLYGKPMPYVMAELPRRIKDALLVDNRIKDVTNFVFDKKRDKLHVTFVVTTDVGNISSEVEVEV